MTWLSMLSLRKWKPVRSQPVLQRRARSNSNQRTCIFMDAERKELPELPQCRAGLSQTSFRRCLEAGITIIPTCFRALCRLSHENPIRDCAALIPSVYPGSSQLAATRDTAICTKEAPQPRLCKQSTCIEHNSETHSNADHIAMAPISAFAPASLFYSDLNAHDVQ